MPAWNQLLEQFLGLRTDDARNTWLNTQLTAALKRVSALRGDRHVILYGSAFLQKPQAAPQSLQISHEDLNGLMAVIYGMDWSRGLTLMLHTPGGVVNAAESWVDYLRAKFDSIESIVPVLSMSAGTMIALSSERIVMGRQSQLGPIDPQMPIGGRTVSARAVVDQFERAREEIIGSESGPGDLRSAHLWAPVLQSVGPSLLQEAQNALEYGESMVSRWLAAYMFKGTADAEEKGRSVAAHFNDATTHKSHGRRINAGEAAGLKVEIENLEDSPDLQEAVLTVYHLMTIVFEQSPASKILWSDEGRTWIKNWVPPEVAQQMAAQGPPRPGGPGQPAPPPMNRQQRRQQERDAGKGR